MIKNLDEFKKEFEKIKKSGPVKTHREGDTGVGKTLEDLLGIPENNSQSPDFDEYELKAHRKNANSMITLITKSPDIPSANTTFLNEYGYINDNGKKELHISLKCGTWVETKDKKHRLSLLIENNYLYVIADNDIKTTCYWSFETIKKAIERKYAANKVVHALALSDKRPDGEYFTYVDAFVADGVSGEKLIKAIKEGMIIVDIRMGTYADGRAHDHGTGFRIQPKNQFAFYDEIVDLVGSYIKDNKNSK